MRGTSCLLTALLAVALLGCDSGGGGGGGAPAPAAAGGSTAAGTTTASTTGASTVSSLLSPGNRTQPLRAGVAVVDITPPVGVPLGGFGEGDRRRTWPDLNPFDYHTLFNPSKGIRDPILAKAVVLDDGVDRVAILCVDLVASGANGGAKMAQHLANAGSRVSGDAVMICASHTHSGPGTLSPLHFWEIAAMDFYQPAIFNTLAQKMASAVLQAEAALEPATLGIGSAQLTGITKNRRAGVSPVYTHDTIDPELSVIKIDKANGQPLATIYNYSIHGLAFWDDNMNYSADLMGDASRVVEAQVGGVALFANGAEGDIVPQRGLGATDDERSRNIGKTLGDAVIQLRASTPTSADIEVSSYAQQIDMGTPFLFITSTRIGNVIPPTIQHIMGFLGYGFGATMPLGDTIMDHEYRFQAIRLGDSVIASIPGEAIHELGLDIKREGKLLGFTNAMVFGLANGHMSYITTETEYWAGGYEGIATLFGPRTGENVRNHCVSMMGAVR
jgi:neutral ceramidase